MSRRFGLGILAIVTAIAATFPLRSLPAQVGDTSPNIPVQDIERHVKVMAADSMGHRDTPSPGLESTARYIAGQFERFGLKPLSALPWGERFGKVCRECVPGNGWLQRYQMPPPIDFTRSNIVFGIGDRRAAAGFSTTARLIRSSMGVLYLPVTPEDRAPRTVVLVAGRHTAQSLQDRWNEMLTRRKWNESGKAESFLLLYVPPPGHLTDSDDLGVETLNELVGRGVQSVVILSGDDSAGFSRRAQTQFYYPVVRVRDGGYWGMSVRRDGIEGLSDVLRASGVDWPRAAADTMPVVHELPSLEVSLDLQWNEVRADTTTAPNVVGVVEGSDSVLRNRYLIFTAHMDAGAGHGPTGSIVDAADDNTLGTAGLLALAQAFSQPGGRPRRSVIFVATSGGAKPGFWGSYALVMGLLGFSGFFSLAPIAPLVADINLDLHEPLSSDSITVDGLDDLILKPLPDWITAVHPELRLTLRRGGTIFDPRSDYFSFLSSPFMFVPSLNIRGEEQGGDHRAASWTNALDRVARVTQFAFYLGQQIANAESNPQWSDQTHHRLLQGQGP